MAEAFSPIAIGASILFLLYIIFARDGEGWQLAAVLIAPSFCWKWWARLMKWYHHD